MVNGHPQYLRKLARIFSRLETEGVRDEDARIVLTHLNSRHDCGACKREVQTRRFPREEIEILHFWTERLSQPERDNPEHKLGRIGTLLAQKHGRKKRKKS